jgi:hypothetical protein
VFTERPSEALDIREERVEKFFGRSRAELIQRMGNVWTVAPELRTGHNGVLSQPGLVVPLLDAFLDGLSR